MSAAVEAAPAMEAPVEVGNAAFAMALETEDMESCAAATGLGALAKSAKSSEEKK